MGHVFISCASNAIPAPFKQMLNETRAKEPSSIAISGVRVWRNWWGCVRSCNLCLDRVCTAEQTIEWKKPTMTDSKRYLCSSKRANGKYFRGADQLSTRWEVQSVEGLGAVAHARRLTVNCTLKALNQWEDRRCALSISWQGVSFPY